MFDQETNEGEAMLLHGEMERIRVVTFAADVGMTPRSSSSLTAASLLPKTAGVAAFSRPPRRARQGAPEAHQAAF